MGLMDMFKSSENKQLKERVNELEKMLSPDQQYAEQLKQTITEREMKIKELDETIQSKYRDIQTAEKAVQQSLSNLNVVNREIDKKNHCHFLWMTNCYLKVLACINQPIHLLSRKNIKFVSLKMRK